MTDEERKDFIFLVRNVVEVYQHEVKQSALKVEKYHSLYISVQLEDRFICEKYEKRIAHIKEVCKKAGLSDNDIESLTKWRD